MKEADSQREIALEQKVEGRVYAVFIEKRCKLLNFLVISNGQYAQTTIPCGTNFQGTLLLVDEFKLQPAKIIEFSNRGGFVGFNEAVKLLNPRVDDARYEQLGRDYVDITNKLYPSGEWVV